MIERKLKIDNELEDSIFLFGARQTGKSTFLREKFPDSIYIDLLDTSVASRFKRTPSLLYDTLIDKPQGTLVIIDEIPAVTYCEDCGEKYSTVEYGKTCPKCSGDNTYLLNGNEIMIKEIEVQ